MDKRSDIVGETSNIGAVVVAAGLSSRMGAYKPLLEIGGVTVARRVIGAFAEAGVNPIVVVTGHRAAELEAHLSELPPDAREASIRAAGSASPLRELLFVKNEDYSTTTMYESAKIGLLRVIGRCSRTFFCPIDVPLFTPATVSRLMACDAPVVKPVYKGIDGHPILIEVTLIPQLVGSAPLRNTLPDGAATRDDNVNGERSLKTALAEFESVTSRIEVDDEGILYDADTPADMKRLTDIFSNNGS
ncbi:MAG: nucleotidyltransferase family protein [Clostridiales Family XIII bacterium]|jgi:CTP:molybdopterin cytidylyltransferase MocA|nr:nucleotidyltransferase family protein [Clostridiales Family XIII bacterium]